MSVVSWSGPITNSETRHTQYGGIIVDVVEDSLDRVSKLLAGVNGGIYQAVGSALERAASAGKTAVKSKITKEYTISQSEFLHNTKNINHFVKTQDGLSVEFGYAGYVIPLIKFNTRVGRDGRVVTQVKRSNVAATLEHAFEAQMYTHRGIFEREGPERLPVHELYGPAVPQMLLNNSDEVDETLEKKMVSTYEQRIEHEILRVLNGWGVR